MSTAQPPAVEGDAARSEGGRPRDSVGPHPEPLLAAAFSAPSRGFVLSCLLGVAAVIIAVFAFDAIVNPYGNFGWSFFPRVIPSDPAAKVALIEALPKPPQIVVLGSSRSMAVDPAYITAKTGLRAFNFGVRGGTAVDAWAEVNYLHDRYPNARIRYLWILDDAGIDVNAIPEDLVTVPQLAKFFPQRLRNAAPSPSLWRLLSWNGLEDSVRATQVRGMQSSARFRSNGEWRTISFSRGVSARGATFSQRLHASAAAEGAIGPLNTHAIAAQYVVRTLAALHRWHDSVVVVMSPEHPLLLRLLAAHGWYRRHWQIFRWLTALRRDDGFQLLDMHAITSFGGSPSGFLDGTHMLPDNLRKLVAAVLKDDHGALQ